MWRRRRWGRRMKRALCLREPTLAEVQDHWEYGHTPFHSWCRLCVIGQGLAEYHVKSDLPIISLNYGYMGDTVNMRDEGPPSPVLCVLQVQPNHSAHGCGFAEKGGDTMDGQQVVDIINELGHCKVVIKADQEHATKELSNWVCERTSEAHSPRMPAETRETKQWTSRANREDHQRPSTHNGVGTVRAHGSANMSSTPCDDVAHPVRSSRAEPKSGPKRLHKSASRGGYRSEHCVSLVNV